MTMYYLLRLPIKGILPSTTIIMEIKVCLIFDVNRVLNEAMNEGNNEREIGRKRNNENIKECFIDIILIKNLKTLFSYH